MKFLTVASNEYPFEGITYSTTVLIYVCDVLFIGLTELNEKDFVFKSVKTGIQKYINKRMA